MEEEEEGIYMYLTVYAKVISKSIMGLNVKQISKAFQRKYWQKSVLGVKA